MIQTVTLICTMMIITAIWMLKFKILLPVVALKYYVFYQANKVIQNLKREEELLRAEKNRLEEIKSRLSEEYKSLKKGNFHET